MDLREQLQSTLGDAYTLERELLGGGMSHVYVAYERALGRKVVVKVLPPELAAGVSIARFRREIQVAATLQHPHIVPLFTAGDVGGLPYFTMPFVEGESLRVRLTHGELPIGAVVSVMRDITKALVYAHAHGVVHRDIKPENVLLSSHAATVLDFGVAKALSASTDPGVPTLTERGVSLGTPAYMSPEQASADPNADHRADIYALGVVAYEMLTGQTPFGGRSPQQLLSAHVTETPTPVDQQRAAIPPALTALVMQCLAKRPADRPQSAEEVLHALEAITTPRGGMTPTTEVGAATRRRNVMLTVAGLVIVAGAATLVSVRGRRMALNPRRIVVAPFANMTGDTTLNVLGPLIAEGVTGALESLDSVEVMSSLVGSSDANRQTRTIAGIEALRSLGQETRAARVVWGSFSRQGDTIRLQAQVVSSRDGRVLMTVGPVTGSIAAPDAAIERLRGDVATAIQASGVKGTVGSMGHLPNPAAYREFLAGWQLAEIGAEAWPYYVRAIQLDSAFTLALYYLATAYANSQQFRAADSVLQVLARQRDRFSPVEQELFEDVDAYAHQDYERELRAIRKIFKRDSTILYAFWVAYTAQSTNRPHEALAVMKPFPESAVPENLPAYWPGIAASHHMLGQYRDELAILRSGRSRFGTKLAQQNGLLNREINALAALGELSQLRQLVDSAVKAWSPDAGGNRNPLQWCERAALELSAHGRRAEGAAYVKKGLEWHASRPGAEGGNRARQLSLASLLMLDGKMDSSRAILTQLAAADSTLANARVPLAIIAARQNDTATVSHTMRVLDSLAKLPYAYGRPILQQARITAALGRKEDAVRLINEAMKAGVPFNWQWHSLDEFQVLRDFTPFKELLRPKG